MKFSIYYNNSVNLALFDIKSTLMLKTKTVRPSRVYSTDRSKAVVLMLVLLFVALWLILRADLF